MIDDATRALVKALEAARAGTAFANDAVRAGTGAEPPDAGVTVRLAGVAMNSATRNMTVRAGPQHLEHGVILHYVITPWHRDAETQHAALGWILRTVLATPVLAAASGSIRVTIAMLTLEAETRLWRALWPATPMMPSLHVEVRTAIAAAGPTA